MIRNKATFIAVQISTIICIMAFAFIFRTAFFGPIGGDTGALTSSYQVVLPGPRGFDKPTQLSIPSISVDAKIQSVGLTSKGAMGIPSNFTDVAWYKNGTIPGEVGSAVIDGHVDNALGLKGVFKYLKDVKVGDDVYITDEAGKTAHFIVRTVDEFPYTDTPTDQIFHESNRSLLRLITCDGTWVQQAKTYDNRLVVTAEYIPEKNATTAGTL